MATPLSVIIAGALIAVAILLTNRWEMAPVAQGASVALRLDRWTGSINVCLLSISDAASVSGMVAGSQFVCGARETR
jgi:hypothetical protein